jgi:formate-dependent nitrite reductase membrane component NrfD
MNSVPSSTYFSAAPGWEWLITLYFFFGGLAGGCYALAVLIDFFGRPEDRPLARLGYFVSFPALVISGLLLIFDLYRPERFWHMLLESNTFRPMFKYWSPMSLGSWALLLFGMFSFAGFLGALAEADRFRWPTARRFRPPGPLGTLLAIIGGIFGFYVAGYTGVLLAVTNRPIWSDTPLLGMLFVVSAASISAALLILLAERNRWTMPSIARLHRMDAWTIALELIVLIAMIVSLGPVGRAWLNWWGVLLLVAVVIGMLLPLAFYWRRGWVGNLNATTAAVLVLLGGFLLRFAIVFSSEWIRI